MIPAKHFYMIRHGETEANLARIMAGHLDSPLTDTGRRQADNARKIVELLEIKPTLIIHSQLSRARDTARIINSNLNLPMVEDADFAEIFVGSLEGATYEECVEMFHGWVDPPGGETHKEFENRIIRAKKKALENNPGPVLIVCHGGVFRALWKMYGLDMDGVRNAHLHEFHPKPEQTSFPWLAHFYDYEDKLIKTEANYKYSGKF
jgi:probable phosphoglycerate mutase